MSRKAIDSVVIDDWEWVRLLMTPDFQSRSLNIVIVFK
jgi:hypothetical protein